MLSARRNGFAESFWRVGFGAWLFAQFAFEVWPAEGALRPLGTIGMFAAGALALGWKEHAMAALLALGWWLRPVPSDPWHCDWIVLVLLASHFALPQAPYGSLAARGRADPAGGWSMPAALVRLRFAALLAFVPYALFPGNAFELDALHALRAEDLERWLAPAGIATGALALLCHERALGWAWLVAALAALALAFEPGKQGSAGLLALALAANLQPGWFPAWRPAGLDTIGYDGGCALCHGFVRFVLAGDPRGERFRFAPLEPGTKPDSIRVQTHDGRTLLRSGAVLHVLRRLGGFERLAAEVLRLVPRPLRDLGYDAIAVVRKRAFGTRSEACPMLPRHLRARFGTRARGPI